MKKKIYLYFSIFFLILFCLVFFYENYRIPILTESLNDNTYKVAFVTSAIPKNSIITEDILNEKITYRNVEASYLFNNPISEIEDMIGKKAKNDIPAGVYLMDDLFVSEDEEYIEDKVLYSFPITTLNAVAKKVRPGDNVTIRVRYQDFVSSDVVIPSITIEDLTDAAGVSVLDSANQSIDWAVVWVTEDELRDLENARKYELFLTLNNDLSNIPEKTFGSSTHNN